MFNIERLCNRISNSISTELNLSQDKREVINYGIFGVIQTVIAIITVVILGIIFNVFIEALLVSIIISVLRKSSGGVHASTPGKCAVIGALVSVVIGKLCRMIDIGTWNILFLSIVVFIWALYLVNKLAPVDSTSKPIKNEKNRKRLKINSIKILIIYFIICLCNIICCQFNSNSKLVTYTLCISLGMTWQVFTLTKIGHIIVVKFDGLF